MSRLICLRLFLLLLMTPLSTAVQVTNIRLRGGPNNSTQIGRIEIQINNNNTWGSVCDDGWDNKDAFVACRMLGYTNGGTAVIDASRFGSGNFNFLMDDSGCTGDESSLTECISAQVPDCTQLTDNEAGVECNNNLGPGQPTPAPTTTTTVGSSIISGNCQQTSPTIRLKAKPGVNGTGFVEAQDPTGRWGSVCDDGWNEAAAKIVCAQLCFPTNYTAKPGIPSEMNPGPNSTLPVILDNVNCVGTEDTLQRCSHGSWGSNDCLQGDGELAGVQCVEATYQPSPAPVPILDCGNGRLVAQFSRAQDPDLEEKHLSVFSQPNCTNVTKSTTANYVTISFPVDKCGTNISRNGTHIIYYNEVKYDFTSQEQLITRANTYRVMLTCSLPIGIEVTQRVQPLTQSVTQASVGNFPLTMQIYRNDSFTTPVQENPVQIPLGEYLNMAIAMEEYDPRLKLVLTNCITTPTGSTGGAVTQPLIENKCNRESTLSLYPLSNFKYGFRFKPFRFVGYDLLYVHCNAIICLAVANTKECDRTCANTKSNVTDASATGRRKRSADVIYRSVNSPAIILYDPHAAGPDFKSTNNNNNHDNEEITSDIGAKDPSLAQNKPGSKEESTTIISQQSEPPQLAGSVTWTPSITGEIPDGNTGLRLLPSFLSIFILPVAIVSLNVGM